MAPAESCASWMKLRPLSGSSTMTLLSTTWPMAALSALISVAAAADTVTSSATVATTSFTSTRARCPT